jgi:hypothetical protein
MHRPPLPERPRDDVERRGVRGIVLGLGTSWTSSLAFSSRLGMSAFAGSVRSRSCACCRPASPCGVACLRRAADDGRIRADRDKISVRVSSPVLSGWSAAVVRSAGTAANPGSGRPLSELAYSESLYARVTGHSRRGRIELFSGPAPPFVVFEDRRYVDGWRLVSTSATPHAVPTPHPTKTVPSHASASVARST